MNRAIRSPCPAMAKRSQLGAPRNSNNTGQVRVYRLIDGNWSRVGEDIDGENGGDYSAWSVSLSSDGQTVANWGAL